MIVEQSEIILRARPRGFHLVTSEITSQIDLSEVRAGTLNLFLKHSSASLSINENCDPSVRDDMENFFNDIVDEDKPYFTHTYEGSDDMPAHLKSVMLGVSLTIPVTDGRLNMGTWQGIYLNEHRDHGGSRRIVATITGV
ncbi:MAG: secondary thiamine-phosphate synthase enzyme YjbQ [Sulfurimonadaceae bacterium]|nr:secondary thiamine-phosphate synthase enzyme YjbQ [Sulfurimonadaceae bacterium]